MDLKKKVLLTLILFSSVNIFSLNEDTKKYAQWGATFGLVPGLIFLLSPDPKGRKMTHAQKVAIFCTFEAICATTGIGCGKLYTYLREKIKAKRVV